MYLSVKRTFKKWHTHQQWRQSIKETQIHVNLPYSFFSFKINPLLCRIDKMDYNLWPFTNFETISDIKPTLVIRFHTIMGALPKLWYKST